MIVLEQGTIKHRGSWAEVLNSGYQLSELSKSQTRQSENENEAQKQSTHGGRPKENADKTQNKHEYDPLQDVDEEYKTAYGKGFKPYAFWIRNAEALSIVAAMVISSMG